MVNIKLSVSIIFLVFFVISPGAFAGQMPLPA
jgi:hypothetical protein